MPSLSDEIYEDLLPLLLHETSHIYVIARSGPAAQLHQRHTRALATANGGFVFTSTVLKNIAKAMVSIPLTIVPATVESFPVNIWNLEITANPESSRPAAIRQAQVINAAWCAHYWRAWRALMARDGAECYGSIIRPGSRVQVTTAISGGTRIWTGNVYGIGTAGRLPMYCVVGYDGDIERGVTQDRIILAGPESAGRKHRSQRKSAAGHATP